MKILALVVSFLVSSSAIAADAWQSYQDLLSKMVTEQGIAWGKFGKPEKGLLQQALKGIADAAPTTTSNDKLAFWVNAHNLCVLSLLSERLPVEDVMKIQGFRDQLTCKVDGTNRSLSQMVSESIRPNFKDPRIHFALWWGTRGGPRLLNVPYRGETLEQQLADQTKRELTGGNLVKLDPAQKKVALSPIFDWFRLDFGKSPDAALEFLRKNLPPADAKLLPKKISSVTYTNFDWSLDRVGG